MSTTVSLNAVVGMPFGLALLTTEKVVQVPAGCPNKHTVPPGAAFCPTCGSPSAATTVRTTVPSALALAIGKAPDEDDWPQSFGNSAAGMFGVFTYTTVWDREAREIVPGAVLIGRVVTGYSVNERSDGGYTESLCLPAADLARHFNETSAWLTSLGLSGPISLYMQASMSS